MDKKFIVNNAEAKVKKYFELVDEIKEYNQEKVLKAFCKNKIGLEHFSTVSGYGHDDMGREALDNVFADIFKAEKAVVRNHFVSGTHTLACCLFGNLRYGEKLVSVAGKPYDTMEEVIGTRGDKRASLIGHGILYDEVDLLNETDVDFEGIRNKIDDKTNMVLIQRSRGYSLRKSLNIETIKKIIEIVKSKNPKCICFVDNCYGEFVEKFEPLEVGADLIAGSLIKNPGGGIVEAGGYIAGKEEYVNQAAYRLTAPGIGSEGGAMLNQSRLIFQGIFMAPSIVSEAVKGAILASQVFEDIGFISTPKPHEIRTDLIQTIKFGAAEPLIEFCKTLQSFSPIESYLTPVPDEVPGYDDKLIMAGGSFIEGSTLELSADGPVREPYAVYMQGGLNYAHVKIALKGIVEKLVK
ncbi:TPA: methionine gamma-lyase family protein [Candidatus Avigastranaerophilus faecigallinarum]|nr:methionine gamma-lyase family protein [Candidatus Avigastranaerophilus faecigallinarum]